MRNEEPKITIEIDAGDAHYLRGYLEETIKWHKRMGRQAHDDAQRILEALKAAGIVEPEVTRA